MVVVLLALGSEVFEHSRINSIRICRITGVNKTNHHDFHQQQV
jgi:hypothetical protein